MELSLLLSQISKTDSVAAAEKQKSYSPSNKSFDSLMDSVGKKENPAVGSTPAKNDTARSKPFKNEAGKGKAPEKTETVYTEKNTVKTETPETPEKSEMAKTTSAGDEAPMDDLKSKEDALVKRLSEILNLSAEAVVQILNSLNLQPSDLSDPANMNLFIQNAVGADDPLQLLMMPDVKGLFDNVNQAVTSVFSGQMVEDAIPADAGPQMDDGKRTLRSNSHIQQNTIKSAGDESSVQKGPVVEITRTTQVDETYASGEQAGASGEQTESEEDSRLYQIRQETSVPRSDTQQNSSTADIPLFRPMAQQFQQFQANMVNDEANIPINMVNAMDNAATAETAKTVTARSAVNTADIINQIAERVKINITPNVSEMKVTLKPEHLGDVTLKVSTENGIVTAQFLAESQRVKEIIEANFNQLKDSLLQQGVQVSELTVNVGSDNDRQDFEQFQNDGRQSRAEGIGDVAGISGEIIEKMNEIDTLMMYDSSVEYTA